MANSILERAARVTENFCDNLDVEIRDKISHSTLEGLTLMIAEAISEQQLNNASRIEEVAHSLRSESTEHELGV